MIQYLGRNYSAGAYENILKLLENSGIKHRGADLIFGIPGQTEKMLLEDIDKLCASDLDHISAYMLTIEKETALASSIRHHLQKNISERRQYRHQIFVENKLREHGFERYEISNYSKNGTVSRHNLGYWKFRPYIGLGAGAHSMFDGKRYANPRSIERYLANEKPTEEKIQLIDLFMGLFRLSRKQGLSIIRKNTQPHEFQEVMKLFRQFENEEMMKIGPGSFQLTHKGLLFSDTMLIRSRIF